MLPFTPVILPEMRSDIRAGAPAATTVVESGAAWLVVVVVVVSVTQLPLGVHVSLTQAPQYGLCGPTVSIVPVWTVFVVWVVTVWASAGPASKLLRSIALAIARVFRMYSSLL